MYSSSTPRFITACSLIAVCLLFIQTSHAQVNYYYKGTGQLNATSSWGTNTDGTGTAPTNFTTILCTYEIRNTTAVTLSSNWTVSGLLSKVVLGNPAVAAATLTIASGVVLSGTIDLAAAASGSNTLVLQSTTLPTFGTINTASTIKYDVAGAQSVSALTYGALIIGNTGTKTLAGNVFVTTGLTVESGATLDAGTSRVLRNGAGTANILINGTLNTSNTNGFSGSNLTTIDNTGTVVTLGSSSLIQYTSASAQSISARTDYAQITLTGNSVKTVQGTTTLSGNMNVNDGSLTNNQTLTVAGSLTGTGGYTSASGTLNLAGSFSNSGTLALSGTSTVHYNGASAQSVRSATYANLSFSNGGTKTYAGDILITAGRTLLVNSTAVVNAGTFQVTSSTATATITINGTYSTADPDGLSGSTITAISSTNTTISPFTTTSTIRYTATSGNQIVTIFAPDSLYGNLVLTGGSLKTTAANFYMLGGTSLTLDAGTSFNMGTRNIKRWGSTGTVTFNINGTFLTALAAGFSGTTGTAINSTGTSIVLGSASVINYTKTTAQTVSSRSDYAVLRLSGAGAKVMDGPITVTDSLNIMESDLGIDAYTLTITGRIGGAGALTGSAASNLVLDGASVSGTMRFTQTLPANRTLNNFTLNVAPGMALTTAVDVGGVLTLTSGALSLNGQTLTLAGTIAATSGTITGSATSSMVINGTGSLGSIPFTAGGRTLNNLTLNRTASGNVTLGTDLVMASTGALTFTNGKLSPGPNTLTINGNLSGMSASNSFSLNGSSILVVGGSGAISSSFYFDQTSASTATANTFTLNRTGSVATLGNALLLAGTLNLNNGTLATGGNLTLLSTASATARVAAITGTGAITGNVTAQRYIPAVARRWRFMSSCMSNATLEDWRSEIFITGAGTGTTAGTLNSNGFDATVNNAPGAYYYTESVAGGSNTGWTAITNSTSSLANIPLVVGRGYRIFIRGDRTDLNRITDNNPTQNEVLMDLRGTINTGDIALPVSYTNSGSSADDGWCLVGNPYPSQYDWNAYWDNGSNFTNIDPTIYVYDPLANSYKSYNASSSGTLTDGIVAQGQSFFVKATAASPSLTLREQFKASAAPLYLFKKAIADEVHIRLKLDSVNHDDYILKFMNAAAKVHDGYDIKAMQGAISLSSYASDSIYHTLDARPLVANTDTVLLKIAAPAGTLSLTFTNLGLIAGKYFFLHDLFNDSIQPLHINNQYTFTIQAANPLTQGNSRFRVIIGNQPVLPVNLVAFHAGMENGKVKLWWTTASEQNSSYFEIERGTERDRFYSIGMIKASGNSSSTRLYEFTDEAPITGKTNYYRLKLVDLNREHTYSEIRAIGADDKTRTLLARVWPNPADKAIRIKPYKQLDAVSLCSVEGATEFSKDMKLTGSDDVQLNISAVSSGIYVLKLYYTDGEEEHVKLMVE